MVNWGVKVLVIELDKIDKNWDYGMVWSLKVFSNNIIQRLHMEVVEILYWILIVVILLK